MPVIAGRTRAQLRQAVGDNLGIRGSPVYIASTATAAGSTTTLKDTALKGTSADEHLSSWVVLTSGTNNAGTIRRVSASSSTNGTTTLTWVTAATDATADGDSYELWDEHYDPAQINRFLDRAIFRTHGQAYDPEEATPWAGDGIRARFDLPSEFAGVREVQYRDYVPWVEIHPSGQVFDEATDSDFTITADTQDNFNEGQSVKIVIGAGAAANDFVTDSISSLDISRYTTIEFWIKSTVATNAGDLELLLDNTASCASPLETLSIPALTADRAEYVRISLANPETDTAIISVGPKYVTDLGACTIRIGRIKAVRDDDAHWDIVPRQAWRIDKKNQDLVLHPDAVALVERFLLKIIGGDKPILLTADSTVNEVDDDYVIAYATFLALSAMSGGPGTDADNLRQQAATWEARAERRFATLSFSMGYREAS